MLVAGSQKSLRDPGVELERSDPRSLRAAQKLFNLGWRPDAKSDNALTTERDFTAPQKTSLAITTA